MNSAEGHERRVVHVYVRDATVLLYKLYERFPTYNKAALVGCVYKNTAVIHTKPVAVAGYVRVGLKAYGTAGGFL